MYLFPSKSTNANWRLATPTIVSVTNDDQPPTFSGKLYLKRTLSQSIHLFSAPDVVSCLSIPGKTLKLAVKEMNTGKFVGFMRFGSPVINCKPRNDMLGNVPDLKVFNKTAIMGFVIVPCQPFGYNYLGGKLLAGLCCSHQVREMLNKKYDMNLVLFETTSLYGKTKGASMYDGMKPFLRYKGNTMSDFIPMLHGKPYLDMVKYVEDIIGVGELVKSDASSRKLKMTTGIIGLVKRALDGEDLKNFNTTIANAKNLTEQKRYYASNYGIENFIDIVNGKTQDIVKAPNYDRYHDNEIIEWWRKMATKRFDNLNKDGRLRNDLEVWTKDSEIDIIRWRLTIMNKWCILYKTKEKLWVIF